MTPQQMGLILSGLDAALKPFLDRKVKSANYTSKSISVVLATERELPEALSSSAPF